MSDISNKEPVKTGSKKNNPYMLDTRNMCLICLKESNAEYDGEGRLICRILARYFGVHLPVPQQMSESQSHEKRQYSDSELPPYHGKSAASLESIYFPMCETCATLACTIGQLYEQLEVTQMKLNEYGHTLCKIITSAEKVSTRVVDFHERFSTDEDTKPSKWIIKCLRREVLKKCTKSKTALKTCSKATFAVPKVVLEKDSSLDDYLVFHQLFSILKIDSSHSTDDIIEFLAYLGCAVSLWLIILLSLLDADELVQTYKAIKLHSLEPPAEESTMELIEWQEQKEQIEVPYLFRKRKAVECNNNLMAIKRPFLSPSLGENSIERKLSNIDESSSDEVTEGDVLRHEFQTTYKNIPNKTTEKKQGQSRKSGSYYTPQEMQLYTLITNKEAASAVKAIQTLVPFAEDGKTLQVKEESEIKLFVSNAKGNQVSTFDMSTPLTTLDDTVAAREIPLQSVVVPPVAIDFVEIQENGLSPSTSQTLSLAVPASEMSVRSPFYKCQVCHVYFHSRAKVEKHRHVVHGLANYVECPCCLQMFSSYFHLEHHRKNVPKCRIDDEAQQQEMLDIARPLFPPELHIKGSNFCLMENCTEVFADITKLNIHLKTHGSFQCHFGCNQVFQKAHELAVHEIHTHKDGLHRPTSLKCPRCDHVDQNENDFLSHFIFTHLNISNFIDECTVCRKGFYTLTGSRAHFHMYHDVAGKEEKSIFRCGICSGAFLRQDQLLEHRKTVHASK